MRNQFRRIGAWILKGFAVNLDRFNQGVQRLIPSTENELTSGLIRQATGSVSSVADGVPVLIWVVDAQAKCTYLNQAWLNFTGRSLQQELGDGWTEGVHPDDLRYCLDTFLTAFHARQPFSIEYRLQQSSGEYRWMLDNGMPQFQNNQEFAGYIGTCVDITHLKQAEFQASANLAEANLWRSRYEAAGRANSQMLYEYDFSLHRMTWEGHVETLLTYSAAELNSQDLTFWLSMVHPDDRAQLQAAIQAIITVKQPIQQLEYRLRCKDGSYIWVQDSNEILLDEVGNVKQVIGFITDITPRKQAEVALRQSQQQLATIAAKIRHSEEQLRLTLDFTGIGAWSWNPTTGEYSWDGKMEALLELPPDLDNMFQVWHDRIHPDDREQVMASLHHALAAQTAFSEEYRYFLQNGQIVWRWVMGQGIYSETGEVLRVLGVVQDISVLKQAELDLRRSEATKNAMIQAIPDLLIRMDRDGLYHELIRSDYLHVLMPSKPVPEATIYDALPDNVAEQQMRYAKLALEMRELQVFEQSLEINGQLCYEEVRIVPLLDQEVLVIIRDISDRKRAEWALHQLNEELEQRVQQRTQDLARSEQDLRTIFNNVYDAIVIHDMDGNILDCNDRSLKLFAATREQLLAANVAHLTAEATQLEIFPATMQRVAAGETLRFEWRARRMSDGTVLEVEVSLRKVTLANRSVTIAGVRDISDRKQAEQQLQAERVRLQLALEAADMGTWESNLETGIWSERTEAIFGYAPGTFPGDREAFLKLVHGDDQERVFNALAHSFATRAPYRVEYRINHLGGLQRWVAVNGTVVDNEDGSGRRIVGVALDITERKQAEQALRDSEERLRLALTAANQGLYDLNVQTGEAIVSPEYATMLGYDPATFQETNAKWIARLHPDDREPVALTYRAYVAGESPHYKVEFRQRTHDGQWKWILSLGKIVAWDETGQPLRMLGTHTDIDERKRAEAQLREQEQFLRGIYEGVRQPIFVSDVLPGNQIRYIGWNPTAAQFVGRTTEEVAGKPIEEIFDAAEGAEIAFRYAQCIQAKHPVTFEERITFHQKTRWVLTTYNPLIDAEGNVYRVVGTVYDITERKQAEDALQQLNLELEQRVSDRTLELQQAMEAAEAANRAKSTFLANMSHELRTPLNAILGFTQLMGRDLTLDVEKRNQLRIINRSGNHLLNLINDILEMSKIEAGRTLFSPNSFDLHTQIDTLGEMFQLRAIEKGLQFIIERDPFLPRHIETDENKLRQVLINLLGNAIKFTQQGSIRLRIHPQEATTSACSLLQHPSAPTSLVLRFEVADTGVGIDAREVDSLFEPFIQSSNRQLAQEGTGLGLSISRQFVQLLGGELTVQTALGIGSTFTFAIPVNRVEVAVPCPVAPPILGLAPTQTPLRLLVVEDNDTNRILLVQLLQSVGFDVRFARDGQQAIAEWETWRPQLIWMDIRMPEMDGYEATRRIRAREKLSASPPTVIIALTANAFEEEHLRVLQVGCDDFMRKPFQDTELLEKIATHLGVQYLYAEPERGIVEAVPADFDAIAALQMLPSALLTQLHQATVELDKQRLAAWLEQISPEQPELGALLLKKLENFDLEDILQLLQKASRSE